MYISPSNIIDSLMELININRDAIDGLIIKYEPGRRLNIFKGMRPTLPRDSFPSLEIEPMSGSMEWLTTEAQTNTYELQFVLTIWTDNIDMSAEYISELTRQFGQLLNNPGNMSFIVNNEVAWNPQGQNVAPALVQFGRVDNISYSSNNEGTIRQAEWTWTGQIIEGFPRDWWDIKLNSEMPTYPPKLSPV